MKRITFIIEVILSTIVVFIPTFFVYKYLSTVTSFWESQVFWSLILAIGWVVVALGYYHQGWLVHTDHSIKNVSVFLPIAVFFIQCILFVKGVYYKDWSLIWGALVVNSGVIFSLYQIVKNRNKY